MFKIQLMNKISPVALQNFDRKRYSVSDEIEKPDAIMVRSASMHDFDLPESVKAVARAGAGVNNIPCDKYAEQGVVVFNTPGANANAVKELVLLGLLISSRKVPAAMEWVQTLKGEGDAVSKLVEKGKSKFVGPEIKGKKLGVIGLGAIGVQVANAANSLGMKVFGYDPYISVDAAWGLSQKVFHATSLNEIYETCDYITIHVPCTKETKGMINSESIAMMKNGVRILNFSRGELVDSDDIIEAVEERKVAKYVTDFATDAQLGNRHIIAMPHLGASTPESEDNCAQMASSELVDFLENGNITNSVNMPSAFMAKSGDARICIIHKNVTRMVSKITTILSDSDINIENMMNASKQEIAYTMLDINGKVDSGMIDTLEKAEGIIRVRVL